MGNTSIEKIYDTINEVLGRTDPQQMLCLTIPGTVLNKERSVYDIRFEKPVKVAANESRINNKLFDVSRVADTDNDRQLSNQFLSALDELTSKVNSSLMEAKEQLRDMFKMPMEYKLEDGTTVQGTLQEAFYYLYGLYVNERKIWAEKQNEKISELEIKYPGTSDEVHIQRQEEFLNWYQKTAERYLLNTEIKKGNVLAIFSPNDMKIIERILFSGSGVELEDREMAEHAKTFDPDGGYVYPVTLQPSDWFDRLGSNMGFIDLLEPSDVYAMQYSALHNKRRAIIRKITMFEISNKNEKLKDILSALKEAEGNMLAAETDLNDIFAEGAALAISGVIDLLPVEGSLDEEMRNANEVANNSLLGTLHSRLDFRKLLKDGEIDKFAAAYKLSSESTNRYMKVAKELAEKAGELIANKSSDYTYELKLSYEQLNIINEEIADVKAKMKMALTKEAESYLFLESI